MYNGSFGGKVNVLGVDSEKEVELNSKELHYLKVGRSSHQSMSRWQLTAAMTRNSGFFTDSLAGRFHCSPTFELDEFFQTAGLQTTIKFIPGAPVKFMV